MKKTYVMRGAHKDMRGFEYLVYSAVSLSLLVVLIALPVAPVFASEEIVGDVVEKPEFETESESVVIQNISDEDTGIETEVADVLSESSEVLIYDEGESSEPESQAEEVVIESNEAVIDELIVTTTHATATGSERTVETTLSTTSVENIELGDETETEVEEIAVEEIVSTTTEEELLVDTVPDTEVEDTVRETNEEVIKDISSNTIFEKGDEGEVISVNTVTTDENKFTFSKDECTLARDGAFYCAKTTSEAKVLNTDRVFSAPDADGDKEIYVERAGEIIAISSNTFDDESPYFDEISNTMVWHRLMNGRYQIISYDFDSGEETQLTNDRYNNMQPSRFGDSTVWQGWVGDDWEIFLLQGDELTMLTDNTTHDVTPSINGSHIVWQSFEGNVWHMKVYDVNTGTIETIQDTDGGSIENLRFVLVYDTKFETGDIQTKGYDLKSGEVLTLGVQPASIPEELPDPEQTGEERALVTSPVQPKTKAEGKSDDDIDENPEEPALSEEEMDVIVPPLVLDAETGTSTDYDSETKEASTTPDIVDVVITPFVEEIESSIDHIEDVVITPFVEPIEE